MSTLSRILGYIRTHKKTTAAVVIGLIVVFLIVQMSTSTKKPEYVTEVVERADLRQTVEAVGTITSERELDLRFAGNGIVNRVYVKEGDRVVVGQRLADLRAGSLGASVAAQSAALQSAQADLNAMIEGTRPEEIAVSEADLQNKKAALQVAKSTVVSAENNLTLSQQKLDALQNEATVSLSGEVTTAISTMTSQLVTAENALSVINGILSDVDLQDALIKDRPEASNEILAQSRNSQTAINTARTLASRATDSPSALVALEQGRAAMSATTSTLDALFSVVNAVRETSSFSNTDRETVKSTISTQRTSVQTAASSMLSARTELQNAFAAYDSKIAAEKSSYTSYEGTRDRAQSDILTYEAAIRSSQAQLDLKKAGARKTDVDSARARVRQAQANLARAAADYNDTVLTAPTTGTITHVNIKTGESLPAGAAIGLLGTSPFRVEMFVSEIDVPRVQVTQSGSIELDAFRGVNMKLRVSDVDQAATDKDGVSKYRVVLDFVYLHNELKIGMTGDAEVETGFKAQVLAVPRRAVLEDDDGRQYVRVLDAEGTAQEKDVVLGMEDGSGDVEVVSGLTEGDTIVVLEK